ncbi:tRNA (N6-isopentenyl adenosine(37)-C2)-methylthiotransferase MiaB [Pendulispora albinea]|uniref:tRNA-2-methylthio-N(6)-dimethylallyladenosine synthase n=1 Tax=Pendulispora albinea TaxID=2741071 RepID=A0ABZ2LIZ4_9BACT
MMARRYCLKTFGCQMNVHDSERMEEALQAFGWKPGAVEEADLVIFNTCSVRDKAEQKVRSEVGKLLPLKLERPHVVLCVAGCVAQQEGERLLSRIRHLDLVIGPDNLHELPALVEGQMAGSPPLARTVFDVDSPQFLEARPQVRGAAAPVSAFVTTMKGCDERCSFCIVPYTRGPERYRPAREIVEEIGRLVESGTREVVLLGQTVDSFRDAELPPPESDDPDESQFPALLRKIAAEVPRLARLRYTSPHPRHATPSLARAHAELDVLAHHVHLPVQSGSDRMLKRMIRRYKRAEYIERAERLRRARPDMTLSTDIIVGFPGETDEDFEATLELVREAGFVQAFAFKFSPRPHTPALKLADDVPEGVKKERLARLFEVVEAQGRAHLERLAGTRAHVLVEGESKTQAADAAHGAHGGHAAHGALAGSIGRAAGTVMLQGRTERNEIVHLEGGSPAWIGQMVPVDILRANKHSLLGRPTESALSELSALSALPRPAPLAPATPSPTVFAAGRAVRSLPLLLEK